MNSNKVKILLLSILLVALIGGRFVLSVRNADQTENQAFPGETAAKGNGGSDVGDDSHNVETEAGSLGDIYDLEIIGAEKTTDNPWGFTAGEFDMEDVGRCVLLTPGTGMSFRIKMQDQKKLALSWMLHPWVSKSSDGAGITVEIYGADKEAPDIEKRCLISDSEEFIEESIDISSLNVDEIKVILQCDSGENENEDADWVVIRMIEIL